MQSGKRPAFVEGSAALVKRMEQRREINASMRSRIGRQIAAGTLEQGAAAHEVAARMVVQGDSYLDQALQELAFRYRGGAPDIFEDFVGFKETVLLEEAETFPVRIGRHVFRLCKKKRARGGAWKVKGP